jgi:4-diphosphocytidyl-2-C-methyl-D-erythritol kinase
VRVTAFAPAKVNLYLHVTGRRADGYHLVDSLVAFADFGDRLTAEPAGSLSLAVDGPEATDLPAIGDDNLVLRAARLPADGRQVLSVWAAGGRLHGGERCAATNRFSTSLSHGPHHPRTEYPAAGA